MQCPGCGFDNEKENKFCNMCGMGLPGAGDSMDAPAEREPLDLDLSLELDDSGPSSDLTFDLGSSDDGGLDFSSGLDISMDMSGPGKDSEMSLNINAAENDDFSLDLGNDQSAMDISGDFSADTTSQIDLEISLDADGGSEMSFDLDDGSQNTAPALADDEDPFAAPDGFEISLNDADTQQASVATAFDEFEIEVEAEAEPAGVAQEYSFADDTQGAEEFVIDSDDGAGLRQIDAHTAAAETAGFDFGDLDTESATDVVSGDDGIDMNEFIVSTNDGFEDIAAPRAYDPAEDGVEELSAGSLDVGSDFTTGSDNVLEIGEESDDDFLSNLIVNAPPAKTASKSAPVVASKPQVKTGPERKPVQVAKTVPVVVETEDSESDDELNNILYGIEGTPKPAGKKVQPQETFEEFSMEEDDSTQVYEEPDGFDSELDVNTIAALGGDVVSTQSADSFAEDDEEQSSINVLEEAPPLSPLEQLAEIRQMLDDSSDLDEKYSLVLRLRDLNLNEAASDFIKLLNDDLKDIREVAAGYLGEISSKEAVRPLVQCLTSDHGQLKFIAARSLGKIGSEDAVMPLIKLLEEDNEDLRYVTLEALGKIGSPSSLKAVSAFLKSRNNDLRYVSCEAIGNIADPKSVTVVLPMLKDPEFEVRLKAIEALGKIGSTAACDQLLVILSEENERIRLATIQALGQIRNANAVEPLVDIFQVSNPQIKEKIVWALGEIGDAKAVEPLLKLSNAFNSKLTMLAIEAFARIKSSKASRYVLSVLEKEDPILCLKAIEALGEIGEKATAGNLVKFLEAAEPEHKMAAARAIGKIGNPIAIEPLVGRLTDSERDVRLAAIEALGFIKGAKAIEPLIKSLGEQDQQIIDKSEWAICEMGEMAVDAITKAMQSEQNNQILPSLVRILGRIGSIRAIFPLLKVLDHTSDKKLSSCVADSLLAIDEYLTTANPISVILKEGYAWAQFSIAQALSQLQDERAFGLLIKIARDALTEKDIKKLAGIPDKRILECSSEILHLIRLNISHLFAKVGNDKAIPVIMNYFTGGDLMQKQWCVEALGGIKTEGALDALIDILKKPEYNIPLELLSRQLIGNQSRKLVEKLILGASHPAEPVRMAIATVLGDTRDPRAIRTLSNLVKDTAEKVRTAAIEAIGKIGTTAAVQPAIEALRDSIETVRAKAAQVLGELKDTAAVEFLEKSTKDSSEMVRRLAVKSLSLMADSRVPDIIITALSDKAESVRTVAVKVLGERRDRVALPHLVKSLEDAAEKVRESTAEALARIGDPQSIMPMLARLDDPSPIVPLACSEAIVSFGENSYEVLIEALKHGEERIRRHACDLLIRIGENNLINRLLRIAQDRNNFLRENIARILGRIGSSNVVETLMRMLSDRSSSVRKTAAESLGSLRDIRCLVALKQATRDQSKEVRLAANMALQEIFKAHKLG